MQLYTPLELYVIVVLQGLGFTSCVRYHRTCNIIARYGSSMVYVPDDGKTLY